MPTLYILCGPPGAGKTYWANAFITGNPEVRYVSRDEIRFAMLQDGENYFSHEKKVFKKFGGTIAQTLVDGFDVIADATHLNARSRKKLTNRIDYFIKDYEIVYVVFLTSYEKCCENNSKRQNLQYVKPTAIHDMMNLFVKPSLEEDSRAKEIIEV